MKNLFKETRRRSLNYLCPVFVRMGCPLCSPPGTWQTIKIGSLLPQSIGARPTRVTSQKFSLSLTHPLRWGKGKGRDTTWEDEEVELGFFPTFLRYILRLKERFTDCLVLNLSLMFRNRWITAQENIFVGISFSFLNCQRIAP